jgi:four helix bundle protein
VEPDDSRRIFDSGEHRRQGPREFANFVSIARGSLAELETFLLLSQQLGYLTEGDNESALALRDDVGRLLTRLHQSLRPQTLP